MKKVILTFSIIASFVLFSSFVLTGCGDTEQNAKEHVEGEAHEHVYACPMHPEITGEKGDKCSKCGMDLKMKEHEH